MSTVLEPITESIAIDAIAVSDNPRTRFDETALKELATSIAEHGLLHPIVVREITDEDREAWADAARLSEEEAAAAAEGARFELIAGERRLRAFRLLKRTEIPARVLDVTAEAAAELRLVENIHREDLHPLEEADAFEQLRFRHEWTVAELAERAGRSERYVRDRLLLRNLTKAPREAFLSGRIQLGHAFLIARLDRATQQEALDRATKNWQGREMEETLTVRSLRDAIARLMQRLKDAPFDPEDAELVPKAGACSECPLRTGAAPGLFPEVQDDDTCTSPTCFRSKIEAAIARAVEEGLTPVAGHGMEEDPLAVEYDAVPYGKWNEVGRDGRGGVKCDDTVKAIVVAGTWQLGKRVRACLNQKCKTHGSGRGGYSSPAQRARERQARERARRLSYVRQAAMEPVVEAVATGPEAYGILYELVVKTIRDSGRKALARRLGVDPQQGDLIAAAAELDERARLEAAITGLLCDRIEWDEEMFDDVAARANVDLMDLFAEARDQKKRPILIPEDVLGSSYPELVKVGKKKNTWDDRPWHVIKPKTKATTVCGLRVKGPDVERRNGFPGRHHRAICGNCEAALEAMVEAEKERRKT